MEGPDQPLIDNGASSQQPATLPQELVDHIVELLDGLHFFELNKEKVQKTKDLGRWALVRLDWARRCRGILHKEVVITSRRSALQFRALMMGPRSDRLTPLLDLIETLDVSTDPKTHKWSWHHLLTTIVPPVPTHKFGNLVIGGTDRTHSVGGSSIHWGVPSSASALPMPYRRVDLWYLHFASLQSLLRLIRSLLCVEELDFWKMTWDEGGTGAPVGNVTLGRQLRSTLTRARFNGCQDNALLLLHTLRLGHTTMQAIPPAEQSVIIQLVECFKVVNTVEAHKPFRYCFCEPFSYTTSQTTINSSQLELDTQGYRVYLSFHYHQTVIGCTALISRDEDETNTALSAFASHHLWHSLSLFPNLRCLIVGLSDVNAIKMLAETHRELWESLGERLHYHRFASQLNAGIDNKWVGHDPASLAQTNEKWPEYREVEKSFTNKM